MKQLKTKKGFLYDYGYYVIILFVCAIMFLVGYFAISKANTSILDSHTFTGVSEQIIQNYETKQPAMINWLFGTMFIGVFITLVILAYSLRTYPIFAGVMILLLIVFTYLSITFANVFYDLSKEPTLASHASKLTVVQFIMDKYPYLIAILGFVFIIILFGTGAGGNNQIPI